MAGPSDGCGLVTFDHIRKKQARISVSVCQICDALGARTSTMFSVNASARTFTNVSRAEVSHVPLHRSVRPLCRGRERAAFKSMLTKIQVVGNWT